MLGNLSPNRRQMLQIGGLGLLGLSMSSVRALRAQSRHPESVKPDKSVLLIYLPGGLSHIDSFDPKPDAPDDTRGEFQAIAAKTEGMRICEHLPTLAARSDKWSLVRSLGHLTTDLPRPITTCSAGRWNCLLLSIVPARCVPTFHRWRPSRVRR